MLCCAVLCCAVVWCGPGVGLLGVVPPCVVGSALGFLYTHPYDDIDDDDDDGDDDHHHHC